MTFTLSISRWHGHRTHPSRRQLTRHYYGTVRDESGREVQIILQSATPYQVTEKTREWIACEFPGAELQVEKGIKEF